MQTAVHMGSAPLWLQAHPSRCAAEGVLQEPPQLALGGMHAGIGCAELCVVGLSGGPGQPRRLPPCWQHGQRGSVKAASRGSSLHGRASCCAGPRGIASKWRLGGLRQVLELVWATAGPWPPHQALMAVKDGYCRSEQVGGPLHSKQPVPEGFREGTEGRNSPCGL